MKETAGEKNGLGQRKEQVMKRTFALFTGGAIAFGSLAMAPTVEAAVRYYGQERYRHAVPVVPQFRESPTYAPDRPAPRFYNNPGRPDFHDGSRG